MGKGFSFDDRGIVDCEYTEEIVCPYCGFVHGDSWEDADSNDNFECHNEKCGKTFSYERDYDVTYISRKIKEQDND